MKAVLKNYRQSPRKVRLVADLVRGKNANEALAMLQFVNKRASESLAKVIRSAVANAVSKGADADALVIDTVMVDEGVTYKRFMPRARGAASAIHKRNSHITVLLKEGKKSNGKTQNTKTANATQ